MGGPRVILSMIVRNEQAVIRRCLRSVRPYIDGYAISDTGSTDGTIAAIREELTGLPGVVIERPWVDFSTNRNEAIGAAGQFDPDYILTLDADEEMQAEPGFTLDGCEADTISARFQMDCESIVWYRKLLFRPHLRYRFVLDEVLVGDTDALLPACMVLSHTDGARNAEGLKAKYDRDIEVLKRAAENEPDSTRYRYYLAQRLAGSERWDEAIESFRKRVEMGGGFEEEIFYSLFWIGQCRDRRGDDWRSVCRAYQEAYTKRPTRAESLFALSRLHAANEEYAISEVYLRAAIKLPRPPDSINVDESLYAWKVADDLAAVLCHQGKLGESIELLRKLRALPQYPASEHERCDENIADIERTLAEAQAEADAAPTLGPDESTYQVHGSHVRARGFRRGLRELGAEYVNNFRAQTLPGPLRWLWIAVVAIVGPRATQFAALACVPAVWLVSHDWRAVLLACSSPLLLVCGRRKALQDPWIAGLVLVAIWAALGGHPILTAAAVFGLLASKEASALMLPAIAGAWLLGRHGIAVGAGAIATGVAAWALSLLAIFGRAAPTLLLRGARGHATPYTADNQSGHWHRLLVDLIALGPVPALLAVLGMFAAPKLAIISGLILAAHIVSPVRNVRTVLAVDLLIRAMAALYVASLSLPLWADIGLIAIAVITDELIARKLRQIYDPVTAVIVGALGMARSS